MNNILNELKSNDMVKNKIALCFLLEYGRIGLQRDNIIEGDRIVEKLKSKNMNNPLINDEYLNSSIEVARKMSELSIKEFRKLIYEDMKLEKRQERGR